MASRPGRQLNESILYLLQKKFQEAMEVSMRVYYLGSLMEYSAARVVSLLNMAGICLTNGKYGEAYTAARQAQLLVEKEGFYDPYLKFCAHKTIANVLALNNNYEESAQLFYQTFLDIELLGEDQYIIDALYNEASVLLAMHFHKDCTNVLDKFVSYIKNCNEHDLSRSFLPRVQYAILAVASKCGPCLVATFVGTVIGGDKYVTSK